jgi:preflagellin peptidase FlaK
VLPASPFVPVLATDAVPPVVPDLLRLLVVPVFGYAAYRDILTRRVDRRIWVPAALLGLVALALDFALVPPGSFSGDRFLIRVGVSLGLVGALGYLFWRLGAFGGADAKAVLLLALCFPTSLSLPAPLAGFPVHESTLGVFSLTILSNTVLLGLAYPFVLAAGNAARGRFRLAMLVGRPVPVDRLAETYGRLLETPAGFTRGGLDLDALRMYLRWRGTTVSAVRERPDALRGPDSLPAADAYNDPTSGSVAEGEPVADGGTVDSDGTDSAPAPDPGVPTSSEATPAVRRVDPWGAAAFLDSVGYAYGTTPADLRDGLELLADPDRETVWVSPGIPFVVPMFGGLVLAVSYGDLLVSLLGLL